MTRNHSKLISQETKNLLHEQAKITKLLISNKKELYKKFH